MDQSSAAEQRAFAVAKLKRAASLPRMKDGRRPPMHVEAVSEGEKSQIEERTALDGNEDSGRLDSESSPILQTDLQEYGIESAHAEREPEPPSITEEHIEEPVTDESPSVQKKRRRSRSRSRGSKDFKAKIRGIAPSPRPLNHTGNDSSQDDEVPSPPGSPPVISPRPSHFLSHPPPIFESPFYPGTSPPTPMLPSLEALRKGLFRSNSASSGIQRMMAMAKLTGEIFDPVAMSPPAAGRLVRNNTVAGGERSDRMAARALLFHRLADRINTEGEQTSGGEELGVRTPTPTKRKRRRRRSSPHPSTVVDDRDDPSTTPNTPLVPPSPLLPSSAPDPPPPRLPISRKASFESETPLDRRGPLIEEEDDIPEQNSPLPPGLPHTPRRLPLDPLVRIPHASDAPSNFSTDSAPGERVPIFLSQKSALRGDIFPTSPFATPLKEKVYLEDEEEPATYQETRIKPNPNQFEREISWVAEPVPESRMPINDDDDDDDENENDHNGNENDDNEHEEDGYDEDDTQEQITTPHTPPSSHTLIEMENFHAQREASPEVTSSNIPPSPATTTAVANSTSDTRLSDDYSSVPIYPSPSPATPAFEQTPTSNEYMDWEEPRFVITDVAPKRSEGGYWERVKNTFSRTNSQNGRRSRTNSAGVRIGRDHTDSSVSRESGASLTSAKTDKGDPFGIFAIQPSQTPIQTHTSSPASASVLSLAPHVPKGGTSPIPAASNADLLKYADAKLFPFPGMMDLERQRTRAKGLLNAKSTSETMLNLEIPMSSPGSSNLASRSPERDRKLSHQASDSRLVTRFGYIPPPMSAAPSSTSTDYFSIPSPQSAAPPTSSHSGSMKLPTTREGVKKWLSAKKLFSSSSGTTTPNTSRSPQDLKHATSMSDLLISRKDSESTADWQEVGSDKSRMAPSNSGSTVRGKRRSNMDAVDDGFGLSLPNIFGKYKTNSPPIMPDTPKSDVTSDPHSTNHSPPEHPSSTTPDPQSSLDDYTTRSTASFSTLSSHPVIDTTQETPNPSILERLDEFLSRGSKHSVLPFAIDDPPRKLMLSSPVLQIVNANTVKDRFLFLFNDVLVIAKPILQDQDTLLDSTKLMNPEDRRFIIKGVVQLRHLQLRIDRDDNIPKAHMSGSVKNALIRTFVHQFAKDPDHAISALFEKAKTRDDPVGLGQLLFRTLDIDRAKLGDYLSRRTSKFVLKSFIEGFGFVGLRIDKALRVFLQTINIPSKSYAYFNPFDYILDAFAGRWYEANSAIVAYDKELAAKLVRAIVQLNEVLHGGIAQEPGVTGYPKRNVIARDFVEAFRRYDLRGLVSDELLEDIYSSLRRERLTQARNPANQGGLSDSIITIKRGLPQRLTYRVQSEPIILRIPQPDAHLNIQLFGQDLTFDPPELNFAKSTEASFRVTGTSLGPKNIIMWRSGANALCYSGLPHSSVIVVERAFMRNTFQIAFADIHGEQRRYMFGVDDPVLRHQWAMSLKRQIDVASTNWESLVSDAGTSKFHVAAESVAFRVLQESLLRDDAIRVYHSESFSYSPPQSPKGKLPRYEPRKNFGASMHARSKSRSQVYHQSMAGKMEIDLEVPIDDDTDVGDVVMQPQKVWKGKDIEIMCRQNSFITTILSCLRVDVPNQTSEDSGELKVTSS